MATTADQNYANHAYRATAWLVACSGAALVTLLFLWNLYVERSLASVALALLGLVVLLTLWVMRMFALRLQDRIIRLEMRIRLARLGLEPAIERLSVKQVVALRFASDGELPALIERALAESLLPDQIKRAITSWQADRLRT
jgi:hypothetical protein